jgi:excisionase family DNA binding protein
MDEILTISQLAEWLQVSKRSVYEMVGTRGSRRMKVPLPTLRIGSTIRFVKADVQHWLDQLKSYRVGGKP